MKCSDVLIFLQIYCIIDIITILCRYKLLLMMDYVALMLFVVLSFKHIYEE